MRNANTDQKDITILYLLGLAFSKKKVLLALLNPEKKAVAVVVKMVSFF